MDSKYPHWYQDDKKMEPCCDYMPKEMCCEEPMAYKMAGYQGETLKDRILCLLGDEVLFSVDARICRRESFCGTLCYVGCDFIIVNISLYKRPVSMHVPINMIRFIAPFKGRHHF